MSVAQRGEERERRTACTDRGTLPLLIEGNGKPEVEAMGEKALHSFVCYRFRVRQHTSSGKSCDKAAKRRERSACALRLHQVRNIVRLLAEWS